MKLTILGCHSATPTGHTRPTSQVLEMRGHMFMIDCGEGTQVALRQAKVKFSRIKHIFISHLHGDHFFGLIGMISTFCLLGRDAPLTIYGPKGIREIILLQLKLTKSYTPFELRFRESVINCVQVIYEDEKVTVTSFPLDHRVPTQGFMFKEKGYERKLNVTACEEFGVDLAYYRRIKKGEDMVLDDGTIVENHLLTYDPDPFKSYAFCSDTKYFPEIVRVIQDVTVLYHESTFLKSHEHLCDRTKHSTAAQAAQIAAMARVGTLILGHYSTRYGSYQLFKDEALEYFNEVLLAQDGKVFNF